MKVEVLKGPLPFGKKYYQRGEKFTVADQRFADLLVKVGRVKEVTDEPPKRRRVYRRRDMQAEQTAVMTASETQE